MANKKDDRVTVKIARKAHRMAKLKAVRKGEFLDKFIERLIQEAR